MTRRLGPEDQSVDGQWRTCVTCQGWLHISEFPQSPGGGRRRHCGPCWKARARAARVKSRDRRNEAKRRWYRENRAYVDAQNAAWRQAHREQYLTYQQTYHQNYMRTYRPENRERINAWNRTYYQANKESINAQRRKRYAALRAV